MLNITTKKFKIKYVMVKSKEMLDNAVHRFSKDASQEYIKAYLEKFKEELPSATITFAIGDECQVVTIKDDTLLHRILFQQFSLDPKVHNWDDFSDIALESEVSAIVLDGKSDECDLKSYIIAFYCGNEYAFVDEHHSFINKSRIKRPVMLCSTSRNMLDVCIEDLKYNKEDIINRVEEIVLGENKQKQFKKIK